MSCLVAAGMLAVGIHEFGGTHGDARYFLVGWCALVILIGALDAWSAFSPRGSSWQVVRAPGQQLVDSSGDRVEPDGTPADDHPTRRPWSTGLAADGGAAGAEQGSPGPRRCPRCEIVLFRKLDREQLHAIVDLVLAGTRSRLGAQGIGLDVDAGAVDWLAEHGWQPEYGARPLRRLVQREVEDRIADLLVSAVPGAGDRVTVRVDGEHLAAAPARDGLPLAA